MEFQLFFPILNGTISLQHQDVEERGIIHFSCHLLHALSIQYQFIHREILTDAQMGVKRISPEFRAEAVSVVLESKRSIVSVAREVGVAEETLRKWVKAERIARGDDSASEYRVPRVESDAEKVRRLERENKELRARVEFLGKATAFFAEKYR